MEHKHWQAIELGALGGAAVASTVIAILSGSGFALVSACGWSFLLGARWAAMTE